MRYHWCLIPELSQVWSSFSSWLWLGIRAVERKKYIIKKISFTTFYLSVCKTVKKNLLGGRKAKKSWCYSHLTFFCGFLVFSLFLFLHFTNKKSLTYSCLKLNWEDRCSYNVHTLMKSWRLYSLTLLSLALRYCRLGHDRRLWRLKRVDSYPLEHKGLFCIQPTR